MKPRVLNTLGPYGGTTPSSSFDEKYTGIRLIKLRYKDVIHSMMIEYDDNGKSVWSAKSEDDPQDTNLVGIALLNFSFPNEYLVSVKGTYRSYLNETVVASLTFETNKRVFGPFGQADGTQFDMVAAADGKIVGFHGSCIHGFYGICTQMLHSIGVYWEPYPHRIETFGVVGPINWDNGVNSGVTKIVIHSRYGIDGIRFEYDNNGKPIHSPQYGTVEDGMMSVIELAYPEEYLVSVSGSFGKFIYSLTFVSNWRTYGPIGRSEYGAKFVFPSGGGRILGFFGSHKPGCIESIGAYTERGPAYFESIGPFGGSSRVKWNDGYYDGIRKIQIFFRDSIDSLKIEYAEKQDKFVWSKNHGSVNKNSKKTEISLEYPEEFLVSVDGYYHTKSDNNVRSLTFKSNRRIYGPFGSGGLGGVTFSISRPNTKVIGFHGLQSVYLNAIGAHIISSLESLKPNPEPNFEFGESSGSNISIPPKHM